MQAQSWQKFLDNLTRIFKLDSLMHEFATLESNPMRAAFCMNRRLVDESLRSWIAANFNPGKFGDGKSEKLAIKYRMEGNQMFLKGNYDKALNAYNLGLLYAPGPCSDERNSGTLALLFGNRSAVHFHMKCYAACASDIQVALDSGYPDDKKFKLYVRLAEAAMNAGNKSEATIAVDAAMDLLSQNEQHAFQAKQLKCKVDLMNFNSEDHYKLFPSKYPLHGGSNSLVPSASRCLQVNFNVSEGRFVTASENIPRGSVVITEVPYAAVLLPPWFETHCQHCFDCVSNHVPCHGCVSVRYCSEQCRKDSWSQYHYFECGKLHLMEAIGIAHLALRIVLVTKKDVLKMYSDLYKNAFIKPEVGKPYLGDYESVYNLVTNDDQMPAEDLFQYAVTAALLCIVLERFGFFTVQSPAHDLAADEFVRDDIAGLLLRHIEQLVCNAHAITALRSSQVHDSRVLEQEQVRLATAIYPTTSLLNHSCEPSIVNSFDKNVLIVKVVRDVMAGERIYNCYGPHFGKMAYRDRQSVLKSQYFFDCRCSKCAAGEVEELRFNSYLCRDCRLTLNASNFVCPSCGKEDAAYLEAQLEEARNLFVNGLKLLQDSSLRQDINAALGKFTKCYEIRKNILAPTHANLAEVQDVMAKCHVMLQNFVCAIELLRACIESCELRFGESSIEVTNELLKLCDVFLEFAVSDSFVENPGRQKYLKDALRLFQRTKSLLLLNKGADVNEMSDLESKETYFRQLHLRL